MLTFAVVYLIACAACFGISILRAKETPYTDVRVSKQTNAITGRVYGN
jgi:hypothetical protein